MGVTWAKQKAQPRSYSRGGDEHTCRACLRKARHFRERLARLMDSFGQFHEADPRAELMLIDENLTRSDLSPAQEAAHTLRLKPSEMRLGGVVRKISPLLPEPSRKGRKGKPSGWN